jgi:hypothetical protein
MAQPVAFHVVMLSSLALLLLAQRRVLCGASGPVDGEDRSVAIPLKTKGGGCLVYRWGKMPTSTILTSPLRVAES